MSEKEINKTSRILSVYHLFSNCDEVSYTELFHIANVSKKTIRRDILTLEDAGVLRAAYSAKRKAFIPVSFERIPVTEENSVRRRYLLRLHRLCMLMDEFRELWIISDSRNFYKNPSPKDWYSNIFPDVSDRTRQRDFKEIEKLGYRIYYEPSFSEAPGGYSYTFPGAFGIDTLD